MYYTKDALPTDLDREIAATAEITQMGESELLDALDDYDIVPPDGLGEDDLATMLTKVVIKTDPLDFLSSRGCCLWEV